MDFNWFDEDREQVLKRSREAGLSRILNPGIDLPSSRAAIRLAEQNQDVFAAVGVHPNESTSWDAEMYTELRALAEHPKVVAIGEIGLDFYRDRAPRALQEKVFRAQLELAAEADLPVIIHNREATEDILKVLEDWLEGREAENLASGERPGVLHSYSGDTPTAEKAIAMGFLIGFTGPVTFRNAPDLQRVAAELPLESLLVETDAPFLAPHPKRGKRNEPANVRLIAEKLAELHGENLETVAQVTTANAQRLFLW